MSEEAFRRIIMKFAEKRIPFIAYAHEKGYALMKLCPYQAADDNGVWHTYNVRKSTINRMRNEIERMRKRYPTAPSLISAECDGTKMTIRKGDEIENVAC